MKTTFSYEVHSYCCHTIGTNTFNSAQSPTQEFRLYAYKVKMLQALQPNDMPRRKEFAVNMLQRISEDKAFLKRVCFSDEATFHVSGKLNKHNVRIWGSETKNFQCHCQGCGVGVGLSSRLGVGVGVGIFYPTPTPHVHFLYVLVMLAAQLTRPRAPVECSTVIFLREPCRVSRDTACDS